MSHRLWDAKFPLVLYARKRGSLPVEGTWYTTGGYLLPCAFVLLGAVYPWTRAPAYSGLALCASCLLEPWLVVVKVVAFYGSFFAAAVRLFLLLSFMPVACCLDRTVVRFLSTFYRLLEWSLLVDKFAYSAAGVHLPSLLRGFESHACIRRL